MYPFKLKMILCDAPAKAYILSIKGHSGYFSCNKCLLEGDYIEGRVCFPNLNFVERTDQDFLNKIQEEHHIGDTILSTVPNLGLVTDVPLDYMHLICLGVVKKLLVQYWCCGKPPYKLPYRNINRISNNLNMCAKYVPAEFSRKPRDLTEVKRWKATEFRQFLLYTGPIVLKNIVSRNVYHVFITLHIAIRILLKNNPGVDLLSLAEDLLRYFVQCGEILYGQSFTSHNVHNLLHLVNDCRKFGSLNNFNCFAYENYMQKLKRYVRKSNNPLPQIVKRISEINNNENVNSTIVSLQGVTFGSEHKLGPLVENCAHPQYKKIQFQHFLLTVFTKDNCCVLKDNSFVIIENIAFNIKENNMVIIGMKFKDVNNLYHKPCHSSLLNIHFVKNLTELLQGPIAHIVSKN